MDEAGKTRAIWGDFEHKLMIGRSVIDIGSGPIPVVPHARPFDTQHGDANKISEFVKDQYDVVFSSHCLEHMLDPREAIKEWWKLVKVGGYLFVIVPDEDLYEQGHFPSVFNGDHKWTFTMCKTKSWSPKSINLLGIGPSLPGGVLESIALQDHGYDRTKIGQDQTIGPALAQIQMIVKKEK